MEREAGGVAEHHISPCQSCILGKSKAHKKPVHVLPPAERRIPTSKTPRATPKTRGENAAKRMTATAQQPSKAQPVHLTTPAAAATAPVPAAGGDPQAQLEADKRAVYRTIINKSRFFYP
ncbi:hypothetical protein Nmel_017379 [Mimus melanotis]